LASVQSEKGTDEWIRMLPFKQQRSENDLNIAKRKAEREASDQKTVCLAMEREIEQLKEQRTFFFLPLVASRSHVR
jgi:hypothetical protein